MRPCRWKAATVVTAAVVALAGCGAVTDGAQLPERPGAAVGEYVGNGVLSGRFLDKRRWRPRVGQTWQWQLTGAVDTTVDADVYDVDLFDVPAQTVRTLRSDGRRVICYLSAGSYEPWRPDSGDFPAAVRGMPVDGFEDEQWLDIRRLDVLLPIMGKRLDLCRAKGFHGAEPDNVDGYANRTGFPLTAADQLRYNRALATMAHARGLAVGLKNDLDQVEQLVGSFDFAVNEQCAQYDECERLTPFIAAGKPVFHAEYELTPDQFCSITQPLRFSSLHKDIDLDASRQTC